MHLYHRNVHRYIFKHVTCYVNLAIFSDWEDVLVVISVLQLLHPTPHGHLHHLQTGPVNLLDQAEDRGENVGILETEKLYRVSPRH